jgi:zinc/manganese transport system substrate-binding protein
MKRWTYILIAGLLLIGLILTACQSTGQSNGGVSTTDNGSTGKVVKVVAAENFWGSIASQVGGSHVAVTSIINDPNADPHNYEPVSQDARTVADAQYVIFNGVGYDAWMDKLLAANPSPNRKILNIGDLFGNKEGDNPHQWYNPDYVTTFVGKVRDDLKAIDPADASAFDQSAQQYLDSGLKQYHSLISDIKAKYSGTPVGASESIFAYMSPSLGLNLITPASYMKAVSEGEDVSASDEAAVEQQVNQKQIKILVFNSQNTPPNIQILLDKCKTLGIPTPTVTETMVPATTTFQDWQSKQLQGIEDALKQATRK